MFKNEVVFVGLKHNCMIYADSQMAVFGANLWFSVSLLIFCSNPSGYKKGK